MKTAKAWFILQLIAYLTIGQVGNLETEGLPTINTNLKVSEPQKYLEDGVLEKEFTIVELTMNGNLFLSSAMLTRFTDGSMQLLFIPGYLHQGSYPDQATAEALVKVLIHRSPEGHMSARIVRSNGLGELASDEHREIAETFLTACDVDKWVVNTESGEIYCRIDLEYLPGEMNEEVWGEFKDGAE